ncbi:MAG: HAD-IA family hydrolase [Deltaproteobacteria bacterium]|nr:HAD-IA family hydrolase [Deltaproteobacteria bacterium]
MHEVDLLVFDLDGTLIRSGDDLAAAVNHALKTVGLPTLTLETVRGFIGDGVKILMKRAVGPDALEHYDRAMDLFSAYYTEHLLDRTTLYPDVPDVLDYFEGKKKAIVTNKLLGCTLQIVKTLGIADRFLEIIGQDSTPFRKPDPRLLQHVMAKWGGTPERTVVIGDGVNDILLGRNAGALSCAFLNGITGRDKLLALAPDLTCETLSGLKTLLC